MINTRTIVIAIIGILIIVGIVYAVSMSRTTTTAETATTTAQTATTSQVQAQDVVVGTGAEAKPDLVVSVLYTGKLPDGTVFDSSAAHGNQPLIFQLGAQGLIPGFQIGVNGMKVGGERVIAIPPALGYGAQDIKDASGTVIIPANSTIQFDVKLVAVQTVAEAQAAQAAAQATSTTPATKKPATTTATKK
ncbi:MAG: Peptidyl-prolyl cis-trans isomerase [Candidatus Kaiserbacteria bacterium]|nr:Peptidyl-prolyl cis-trans isomerase [Candidatus Kaiserbacteria bacterium]